MGKVATACRSRLGLPDLGFPWPLVGASSAGSPPLPLAPGDVIEVERTVNASANASLGNHMVSAGCRWPGSGSVPYACCVTG